MGPKVKFLESSERQLQRGGYFRHIRQSLLIRLSRTTSGRGAKTLSRLGMLTLNKGDVSFENRDRQRIQ